MQTQSQRLWAETPSCVLGLPADEPPLFDWVLADFLVRDQSGQSLHQIHEQHFEPQQHAAPKPGAEDSMPPIHLAARCTLAKTASRPQPQNVPPQQQTSHR